MLLLLVLALCTCSVKTLTCHCFNNTECSANGYCSSGCDDGWSGPGCQVGNVALKKSAYQSTTYSDSQYTGNASLAVDGVVPHPPVTSAEFCSHTALNQNSAWWYVTLSTTRKFVITNVTLVNRNDTQQPSNNERLRDFVILYSNETAGNPDPNNTIWNECARQKGAIGYSRTYSCNSTAIAKHVAVYMLSPENPILTLCEVKVFGYQLDDCPRGFTGPGCLLRICDGQCNATGGRCDEEYGSCRYDVCPDRSLLPPYCWITLSNYSAVEIKSVATCNTVLFSAEMNYSQPNIAATMLLLRVSNSSNGLTLVNITMPVSTQIFYSYNISSPGTTYNVSVTPIYCDITKFPCFSSTGSKVFPSVIGKRDYQLLNNQSCFFVHLNSSTAGCERPTAVEIKCKNNYTSEMSANSSSFVSCGLEEGQEYECSVTATINKATNWYESRTFGPTFITSKRPFLETSTETPSANTTAIVAGSIVGVVVVIFITSVIAVVYNKRQRSAKAKMPVLRADSTVVLNMTNVPPYCSSNPAAEGNDQTYCNISGMTLSQFQQYVKDDALITRRFSELQANKSLPCTKGKAPENKGKNRFQNILPYDSNRVLLDGAGNDYINASYIDGFFKHKEFIATQGPSPKTVEDFWKMLWQENCSVIIMLTDYVEHAKKKCEKYFPFPKSSTIDLEVTLRSTCIYDTHSVSVLAVRHGSEVRLVYHFHFLAWPDQSVPNHSAEVLLFYNRICRHLKLHHSKGPVIVHCSAGVGRTGAYLAFDYLQQRYQSERIIDVDSCVAKLRDQRMFMVQTKDQYLFLHRAVLYGIQTTRYIYEAAQLSAMAQAGAISDVGIDMATEWLELEALVQRFHVMNYATAARPENKCKNRRNDILALDSKRPMISLPDGSNQLYINAVYCNGCFSNRAFIATQLPLKHTVADFWLMVYDCQPSCIVLLHNLLTDDEECPRFWPEPGHSVTTDWLEVKCDLGWKEQSTSNTLMPGFGITLSPVSGRMTARQTVSTKLFTTSLWDTKSSAELPENSNHLLTTAMALRAYSVDAPHQPIIVQCSDGVTQCGLFLSAMNALHRLIETGQVSVFHTVDLLRSSRPEFVTSEAQYRFIYKLLEIYRESSNIYANA